MQEVFSPSVVIGLAITFLFLSIVFVALRVWARLIKIGKLRVDDYLCIGGLIISIVCTALELWAAFEGRLGTHQIVDAQGKLILDEPHFIVFENAKFAVNILSVVGLGLIKASILIFYKSIFDLQHFRIAVYVMLGIVVSWTITYFFVIMFICYPITPLIEPFFGNTCIDVVPMWFSLVSTDLIVDVFILLMPVPMVLRLQLPWKGRLGVLAMFGLGATVCAISATRLVTFIEIGNEFKNHPNDVTFYTSPTFYWTTIELAIAVLSSCLPLLRPVWLRFRPPPPSTMASSYSTGSRKTHHYGDVDAIALVSVSQTQDGDRDRDRDRDMA